jgi:hypothetical protein
MMDNVHGRNLSPEQLARIVDEFVNGADDREFNAFAEYLTQRVHRTLQQKVMGLFVRCIERWAGLDSDQFDLRNQATVELCKKIVQATGDKYDRYLPLI